MSTPSGAIPAPQPPKRLRFIDYLGIFFGITTVVSLALAYYWHAQSVEERLPTYYVSPARARIVDTSVPAPPQLQVLYQGKDLNANVSAVIVYLWNDGKLPIRSEDVLEPVQIQLEPGCAIIDARILKVSRAVTKFEKGDVSETAKNLLPVTFGILEHNDGAVLQIIYTGKPEARASVAGTIVGPGPPREVLSQQLHPIDQGRVRKLFVAILAVLTAMLCATYILLAWRIYKKGMSIPRQDLVTVTAGVALNVILLFGVAYYVHRRSQPVVPPTIWMNQ